MVRVLQGSGIKENMGPAMAEHARNASAWEEEAAQPAVRSRVTWVAWQNPVQESMVSFWMRYTNNLAYVPHATQGAPIRTAKTELKARHS